MRLMPQSLRGQVLLAVLAALVVAQLAGLFLSDLARIHVVRQIRIAQAVDAAAALMIELDQTPPSASRPLLRAASSPLTRYRIDRRPAVSVSDGNLIYMLDRLEGALSVPASERSPKIALEGASRVPDAEDSADLPMRRHEFHRRAAARGLSGERLHLSLPMADGRWLNASVRFPGLAPAVRDQANLTLILSALAIGGVLWLVLARLLGPLRGLAGAAEALGRGEARDLAVSGPAEIRALTEAFNDMQARLHRLMRDRTQMLAALGHDLRSPLTALRVRVEMLEDDDDRTRMNASLDEMQEMIEQTLNWARGVWSGEEVVEMDLAELLRDLIGDCLADDCEISHSMPESVPFRGRPLALRRALRNLIDNGCRYGDRVEAALKVNPAQVQIEIRDRGPGIPDDRLSEVLDPFVRVEGSRSRETGGTGLGWRSRKASRSCMAARSCWKIAQAAG